MKVGVNHLTLEVSEGTINLEGDVAHLFGELLQWERIPVEEDVPDDWRVEWWKSPDGFVLHLVEVPGFPTGANLGVGHICICVGNRTWEHFDRSNDYVERNSGSGRIWLNCRGIRIELRSEDREVRPTGDPGDTLAGRETAGERHAIAPVGPMNYLRRDVEPRHWDHAQVLERALEVYKQRSEVYGDRNWKREGWRGALFNLRRKVERAWDVLWNGAHTEDAIDDLLDVINYAAFAIRGVESQEEGDWWDGKAES